MTTIRAPAFFPPSDYPELGPVRADWPAIRDEAHSLLPEMIWVEDYRMTSKVWAFGPLLLEEGDRTPARDHLSEIMRRRASRTMALLHRIPTMIGCGFSLLLAGGRIGKHVHSQPFVTAILGLTPAHPCWIVAGTETHPIRQGEFTIFDYTQPHEVVNESAVDRMALLVLLPNKSLNKPSNKTVPPHLVG